MQFVIVSINFSLSPFSAKDSGLVKKVRDLLSHQAFGSDPPSGMSQDYNKPLLIPAWSDSFQAILGGGGGDQVAGAAGIDVMKHHFTTHFPQSVGAQHVVQAPVGAIYFASVDPPLRGYTEGGRHCPRAQNSSDKALERTCST